MRSRPKIIDATLDVIARKGFRGVSIASVAAAAGVSRQTVYSVFATREDLVSQSMIALVTEVFGEVEGSLESIDDPTEFLVELIVVARATVRAHPVLAALLTGDADNPLNQGDVMERAKPIAYEILSPMKDMHPDVEPMMDDIFQMGVRLGLSVILFDDAALRSDDDLRGFLSRWLGSALPPKT
ncbi:TetR/AcrR family transcriptional regulator [Actinomycetes bacterium M1A6_2h]